MEYQVTWIIELDAGSPEEAAAEALDCIVNGDVKFFEVTDTDGQTVGVDLGSVTVDVSKLADTEQEADNEM